MTGSHLGTTARRCFATRRPVLPWPTYGPGLSVLATPPVVGLLPHPALPRTVRIMNGESGAETYEDGTSTDSKRPGNSPASEHLKPSHLPYLLRPSLTQLSLEQSGESESPSAHP
ncbi:hypothetical protein QAD02_006131 [Eretmocerus hayati]|uniref:Uncharacterized protein n=1 Tax=Eretmocerus hayati TaxID=131215 RepID=A0ACC2N0E1_9HYME|nr:hypothetical protein QAD02_006131 [Eretmocerus hayati]